VAWRALRAALDRNAQDRLTPAGGKGFAAGDEGEESMQGRQPAVAGGNRPAAIPFDMVEKGDHLLGRQVRQTQARDVPSPALSHKTQEKTPAIAVRDDRGPRGIPLSGHPVVKEVVKQLRQRVRLQREQTTQTSAWTKKLCEGK
jgi:hypothetical protein